MSAAAPSFSETLMKYCLEDETFVRDLLEHHTPQATAPAKKVVELFYATINKVLKPDFVDKCFEAAAKQKMGEIKAMAEKAHKGKKNRSQSVPFNHYVKPSAKAADSHH